MDGDDLLLKNCWSPRILYQMGVNAYNRGEPITACPVDDTWKEPDRARTCFERGWNTTQEAIMNPIRVDDREFIDALVKQGKTEDQARQIIKKMIEFAFHSWQVNVNLAIRRMVFNGECTINLGATAIEIVLINWWKVIDESGSFVVVPATTKEEATAKSGIARVQSVVKATAADIHALEQTSG